MHESTYNEMARLVPFFIKPEQKVKILDIGSFDFNGSYKPIFNSYNWDYLGIDICSGKNVDLIVEPNNWGLKSNSFDLVISGSCLEHVAEPWKWIVEAERVCKKGHVLIISVPCSWAWHRMPIDCWRIYPDGMASLLTNCAHMNILSCEIINNTDTFAIAEKL
jgi:SAM-dependent methyltransferase